MKEVSLIKALSEFVLFFAVLYYGVVFICKINAGSMVYFLLSLLTLIVCFFVRRSNQISYYASVDEFKKGLIIISVMLGISVFSHGFNNLENVLVPCIIIYIVSSVTLLRTLRYMQYNESNGYLNKINLLYSGIVIISSIILSIKAIRELIVKVVLYAYNIIINIVLFFISWILFGVGYLVELAIIFVRKLLVGINLSKAMPQAQRSPFADMKEIKRTDLIDTLFKNKLVIFLIQAAVIFLIIYAIFKLFKGHTNFNREEEEYIESKEFLKKDNGYGNSRRLSTIFKPKTYSQYIRYYYGKFLKLCIDRKIDIKSSDTTFQIGEKSSNTFDKETLNLMRRIYLSVRYNDDDSSRSTMNDFHNYYKKLRKNSRI